MSTKRANLGVYWDRPASQVPAGGMTDCLNVRVKEGEIRAENMGWRKLEGISTPLNGQVLLVHTLRLRVGTNVLIFGTQLDLYQYEEGTPKKALFITPTYETGTVTVANGDETVVFSADFAASDIKAGDFIHVGAAGQDDPAETWYEIDSVTAAGGGGVNSVELTVPWPGGSSGGNDFTVRQVFTGDNLNIWVAANFPDDITMAEDTWYATNGTNIVHWNGSDATVTVWDPGWTCKGLAYFKNLMLFYDIVDTGVYSPGTVKWSDLGDPQATAAEAGEMVVGNGLDSIGVAEPLGDAAVAYCIGHGSVNLMQWVGGTLGFIVRTVVDAVSIVSSRALVNQGNVHEFAARGQVYAFDGVTSVPVGSQVFREALRRIDPSRQAKALAYIDRENAEALLVLPHTTDSVDTDAGPKMAYVAHYLEDVGNRPVPITVRELPATAIGEYARTGVVNWDDLSGEQFDEYAFAWNDRFFAANFPITLFGDEDGYVYELGVSEAQDGADIPTRARFARFPLWDGRNKGVVARIEPQATDRYGSTLEVKLYTAKYKDGELALASTLPYDLSQDGGNRFVTPRKSGLYGEVELAMTAIEGWAASGYAVELVKGGGR